MKFDRPIDPDRWVDEHGDALFGYAMLRLRDHDLAAEVVQETFLQALRGASRFRGGSTERTWLVGILKHKILDQFRAKARRERSGGGVDAAGDSFFDAQGSWKAGGSTWAELPDATVERLEFWAVFHACLAEIPTIYADAFTLTEIEGLGGPEACEILGISPANLWARLHRARLMLRNKLDDRWFGVDR